MKKITVTLLLFFSVTLCKAQWVTIPDPIFANFLESDSYIGPCMNGNQMDTTCSGVVGTYLIDLDFYDITDLTGIQYFDNLGQLYCSHDSITNIPSLPGNLYMLSVDFNQLTNLPSLPNSLHILHCTDNQLTSLPALPNGLTQLYAQNNFITSLPVLPDSLDMFFIANNPIQCMVPMDYFGGVDQDFDISGTSISCMPNLIPHNGFIPQIDTLPLCYNNNPNGCPLYWEINGRIYFDSNNNCSYDTGDITNQNIKVQL